jgi:hypothetical protein
MFYIKFILTTFIVLDEHMLLITVRRTAMKLLKLKKKLSVDVTNSLHTYFY